MTQETRRRVDAVRYWLDTMPADRRGTRPREVRTPRFSRGGERRAVPLDRLHVGRFSAGIEALPEDAAGKSHIGRFSDGIEALPEGAGGSSRIGGFGDGAATRSHLAHPAA